MPLSRIPVGDLLPINPGVLLAIVALACLPTLTPVSAQIQAVVPPCAAPGEDPDADGLPDGCEFALARTFAPRLNVRRGGCNWIPESDPHQLGGGYYFAAQPVRGRVRVAYLPAYFLDCGWRGTKCWLPGVDCAPHTGDSEVVIIELLPDSAQLRFSVTGVFLSAHCFGRSGEACRWYRDDALRQMEWSGPNPTIWVAEGRNANYPSKAACDRGHYSLDTCDHNESSYLFPVIEAHNVGSRAHPIAGDGCVAGMVPFADRLECFWNEKPFRGWQSTGRGATPYSRYLTEVAGF